MILKWYIKFLDKVLPSFIPCPALFQIVLEYRNELSNHVTPTWKIEDCDSGDPGHYAPFISFTCSKCGAEFSFESGEYGWYYGEPIPWDYCPICGNH